MDQLAKLVTERDLSGPQTSAVAFEWKIGLDGRVWVVDRVPCRATGEPERGRVQGKGCARVVGRMGSRPK